MSHSASFHSEDKIAPSKPGIKHLVVDDGSTDPNSIKILSELEQKYENLKVLRKSNSGVAETRNFGGLQASSQYIALLDADDLVGFEYYEKCINILEAYSNVGYVGCWNEDFNEEGLIRIWPTFSPEPPNQFIFNTVNCHGIVIRKDAYLRYGQHDPKLKMFLDDWESTINLLSNNVRGVMIPEALFRYRIRANSIFWDRASLWKRNYNYITLKHKAAFSQYSTEIIMFLNENGPNDLYHNPTHNSYLLTLRDRDRQFHQHRVLLGEFLPSSINRFLGEMLCSSARLIKSRKYASKKMTLVGNAIERLGIALWNQSQ